MGTAGVDLGAAWGAPGVHGGFFIFALQVLPHLLLEMLLSPGAGSRQRYVLTGGSLCLLLEREAVGVSCPILCPKPRDVAGSLSPEPCCCPCAALVLCRLWD